MSRSSSAIKPRDAVAEGNDPVMDGRTSPAGDGAGEDGGDQHHELRTDHLLTNIGRRSVRGGVIMFSAQAVKVLAQFGSVVVLVRLLPPADFGLIAMTAAIYALLDPIRDLGLSAATIQKPDLAHDEISTLFWINLALGSSMAAVLFLAAPLVALFYHQPPLTAVTRWLALGLLLNGFCSQHWALLRRQMRFGAVAALETSAEMLSFAAAIALAWSGAGYWALVAQRLVGPVLIAPGCWVLCRWRPSRPAFAPGARSLLSFGSSMAATALVNLFARSIDQVAVGWFWGAIPLGFYDRATKLLISPLNQIMLPLYSIGMPALSRLSDDEERYRRGFSEILEKLAMVTMPGAALIAVTADWTTAVVLGPKWAAAAPLVACFAVVAAFQPSLDTSGLLFLTHARARQFWNAGLIDAGLRVAAVAASLWFGSVAVAATLTATGLLIRAPVGLYLATRGAPVRLGRIYRTLAPPALAACSGAAVVLALRHFALPAEISPLRGLLEVLPAGAATILAVYGLVPGSRHALLGVWRRGAALLSSG